VAFERDGKYRAFLWFRFLPVWDSSLPVQFNAAPAAIYANTYVFSFFSPGSFPRIRERQYVPKINLWFDTVDKTFEQDSEGLYFPNEDHERVFKPPDTDAEEWAWMREWKGSAEVKPIEPWESSSMMLDYMPLRKVALARCREQCAAIPPPTMLR
jgi:hypothetical protein